MNSELHVYILSDNNYLYLFLFYSFAVKFRTIEIVKQCHRKEYIYSHLEAYRDRENTYIVIWRHTGIGRIHI